MLSLPVVPYDVAGYHFGQRIRRRIFLWAIHLGDDVGAPPGTPVHAIGAGEVVWSEMRPGTQDHRNWGGVVVLKHHRKKAINKRQHFFSIYGHMTNLRVKRGERVQPGQELGSVAAGNTLANGWWKTPHLHFALYTGPWRDQVLPGYQRPDDWLRLSPRRTRMKWWHDPRQFIEEFNALDSSL